MDRIYTVVRQTMLPAAAEEAWRYLTDGAMLTSWFADSDDLRPGGPFHFAFGDGDYFSGTVTEWEPPVSLGLGWRFLGAGPLFDIRFSLLPVGEATELTVQDRGAATVEEAAGLHEGWEDFLMRCEKFARTGENSRYRWTETFGGTAFVPDVAALQSCLDDPALWRSAFPGAATDIRIGAEAVEVSFQDPAWGDTRTQAELRFGTTRGRCSVHLVHRGWGSLPFETQVSERRRYGARWAALLQEMEIGIPVTS